MSNDNDGKINTDEIARFAIHRLRAALQFWSDLRKSNWLKHHAAADVLASWGEALLFHQPSKLPDDLRSSLRELAGNSNEILSDYLRTKGPRKVLIELFNFPKPWRDRERYLQSMSPDKRSVRLKELESISLRFFEDIYRQGHALWVAQMLWGFGNITDSSLSGFEEDYSNALFLFIGNVDTFQGAERLAEDIYWTYLESIDLDEFDERKPARPIQWYANRPAQWSEIIGAYWFKGGDIQYPLCLVQSYLDPDICECGACCQCFVRQNFREQQ